MTIPVVEEMMHGWKEGRSSVLGCIPGCCRRIQELSITMFITQHEGNNRAIESYNELDENLLRTPPTAQGWATTGLRDWITEDLYECEPPTLSSDFSIGQCRLSCCTKNRRTTTTCASFITLHPTVPLCVPWAVLHSSLHEFFKQVHGIQYVILYHPDIRTWKPGQCGFDGGQVVVHGEVARTLENKPM